MEIIKQAWPWYITGPLIGLMVPLLLLLGNKQFGISSSLRHICAACIPTKAPYFSYNWKKEIWNLVFALGIVAGAFVAFHYLTVYDGTAHPRAYYTNMPIGNESVPGLAGLIDVFNYPVQAGRVYPSMAESSWFLFHSWGLQSAYDHPHPLEIFSWQSLLTPAGFIFMVAGGFLVGFGTRYANGCTSGHAIMGLSQGSPASLVATIGFFIGGLTGSWVLVPLLVQWL